MCGRFSLSTVEKHLIIDRFRVDVPIELKPRYNIAPTQETPVILNENSSVLSMAKWGLIPSWSQDSRIAYKTINARAETVSEKPAYKNSFQKHRCLVIADSFFEWDKRSGRKTPFRIMMEDESLFSFAGIYSKWNEITTFSIVTTEPNELMSKIHIRMPVILHKEDEKRWLEEPAKDILVPFTGEMKMYEISTLVNSPKNDTPEILKKVERDDLRKFF